MNRWLLDRGAPAEGGARPDNSRFEEAVVERLVQVIEGPGFERPGGEQLVGGDKNDQWPGATGASRKVRTRTLRPEARVVVTESISRAPS